MEATKCYHYVSFVSVPGEVFNFDVESEVSAEKLSEWLMTQGDVNAWSVYYGKGIDLT